MVFLFFLFLCVCVCVCVFFFFFFFFFCVCFFFFFFFFPPPNLCVRLVDYHPDVRKEGKVLTKKKTMPKASLPHLLIILFYR